MIDDAAQSIAALGPVLVVAPHPDDESIGCGGLIALLRERGSPVSVLLLSDGTMSHPNSKRFPAAARRELRWRELVDALDVLGVAPTCIDAMGWADGALPFAGEAAFAAAVDEMRGFMRARQARTLLVPWRRDTHRDHRAAHAIACAANDQLAQRLRVLEYAVWTAERGSRDDHPADGEARTWTLDISRVVDKKARAVAAHRSQHGGVIDDDPAGFTLSPTMLARCRQPTETYYEVHAAHEARRVEEASPEACHGAQA